MCCRDYRQSIPRLDLNETTRVLCNETYNLFAGAQGCARGSRVMTQASPLTWTCLMSRCMFGSDVPHKLTRSERLFGSMVEGLRIASWMSSPIASPTH